MQDRTGPGLIVYEIEGERQAKKKKKKILRTRQGHSRSAILCYKLL